MITNKKRRRILSRGKAAANGLLQAESQLRVTRKIIREIEAVQAETAVLQKATAENLIEARKVLHSRHVAKTSSI